MKPSVTLLFPAWNEQDYVERAVELAHEALRRVTDDYEILIIDDASTDATPVLCERMTKASPRVRVIRHATNQKLGGALKTGFAAARKDIVVYSDIDLPWDLAELERALHVMEFLDADVISAFRFDRTSEGPKRIVYSFAYNLLIRALFGVYVKDINFSFKVVRREVLQALDLRSSGSFIDAELIVKAMRSGFKVFQIGVDYFPRTRGVSTLASPRVIAKMVKELVELYPETKWPKSKPVQRTSKPLATVVPLVSGG